jgi:hypothetical protein
MTLKWRVLTCLEEHPDWNGQEVAEFCGCTRAYVSLLSPKRRPRGPKKGCPPPDTIADRASMELSGWYYDELGIPTRELRGV